jgi:hypothetical protein
MEEIIKAWTILTSRSSATLTSVCKIPNHGHTWPMTYFQRLGDKYPPPSLEFFKRTI